MHSSNTPPPRVYHTRRLAGPPPEIDGKLGDACWRQGSWAGGYLQREPHFGRAASQPTEIKILYDDHDIYVAIRAHDSELASQPRYRGRRDEFIGDMVGVAFDSYFDGRTAFEFDVTSGGSKVDLVAANGGFDTSWNAVWDAKVAIEAAAWTAEFRIPFSQLRYADKPQQVWGLHSWRRIFRLQEESNWQPIPVENPLFVLYFGELRGLRDPPRARRVEILPYVLAGYATSATETGNPYRTGADSTFKAGLDAKIGLGSNFTLDATFNPDFGQVEADPSEINLTTYETFFEEKRPFFLEGKNIFSFGLKDGDRLFHSRHIGHKPAFSPPTTGYIDRPTSTRILGAVKVAGKTADGLAVGILYGLTDREAARITENGVERRETVEPLTHHLVARAQKDLNRGKTVLGGMATGVFRRIDDEKLDFLADRAIAGGLNLIHYWSDRTYFFETLLAGSRVEGSPTAITHLLKNPVHNYQRTDATHLGVENEATSLDGTGGSLEAGKSSHGRWRYHARFDWRSPGFELNDLGYLYVADQVRQSVFLRYIVTTPGVRLRRYNIDFNHQRISDFSGTELQGRTWTEASVKFNNNWSTKGRAGYDSELLDTRVLRGGPALLLPPRVSASAQIDSDATKSLYWNFGIGWDAWPAGGSRSTRFNAGFWVRLFNSANLGITTSYTANLDDFQYAGGATTGDNIRHLMARMNQQTFDETIRLSVNFTPRLSLDYYGSAFATHGRFSDLKLITSPRAGRYEDRFRRINAAAFYDATAGTYRVEDGGAQYTFKNPDFSLREFNSNLVLRWEYRLGSTLSVIWTQDRSNTDRAPGFAIGPEYRRLFGAHPNNTLLIKLSHWFNL